MATPTSNDPTPASAEAEGRVHWAWWIAAAVLSLIPALWADDAPFINDEPMLIRKALHANAAGVWEQVGLSGTLGRPYGPLPTWIYQIGLGLTHDLVTLVRLRTVLMLATTLACVLWITRLVRLTPALILLVATSPYLLAYARQLWDNSFLIPLSTLAAALTLHVLIRRTLWPAPLLVAVGGAMLLVHAMAIAPVAAIVLALAIWGWPAIARSRWPVRLGVLIGCVAVLVVGWLITAEYRAAYAYADRVADPPISVHPNGWWFALLSPRLISALWIEYFFPADYLEQSPGYAAFNIACVLSAGAFLLAWTGAICTIVRLKPWTHPHTIVGGLALLTLTAQLALNAYTRTYGHPHYYNATWFAPLLLAGVALASIERWKRPAPWVICGVLSATLAFCTVYLACRLHTTGGTRFDTRGTISGYGPTLANQQQVARTLHRYDPKSTPTVSVFVFPWSLDALRELEGPAPTDPLPADSLEIRYANPIDPQDGRIAVYANGQPVALD